MIIKGIEYFLIVLEHTIDYIFIEKLPSHCSTCLKVKLLNIDTYYLFKKCYNFIDIFSII